MELENQARIMKSSVDDFQNNVFSLGMNFEEMKEQIRGTFQFFHLRFNSIIFS